MENARFTMIDEKFKCIVCGKDVLPLGYTARDHCPFCLCSIHVDINPGDRACTCKGILEPIRIEKGRKDELKIVYRCNKCKAEKRNKVAKDDDFDMILSIMKESSL